MSFALVYIWSTLINGRKSVTSTERYSEQQACSYDGGGQTIDRIDPDMPVETEAEAVVPE